MSLFSSADIELPGETEIKLPQGKFDDSHSWAMHVKSRKEIVSIIPEDHSCGHYVTQGKFSSHDLLIVLLERTGPAKVYITTWTMTEYPARVLTEGISSGRITELNCLMDVRMEKNPNIMQLIKFNSSKIKLTQCHAKVMVVEGEKTSYCVVSSQNQTENPRIEAGVITSNPTISDFHKHWIMEEINNGDRLK